jgi:Haem-binding domain
VGIRTGLARAWHWRWLRYSVVGLAVVFVAIQFVPYGWWHSNPPVTLAAPWPDEESERIARSSCYACHSNETDWPLYSWVAPMSWLVRSDVEAGRHELNFSTWDRDAGEADDAVETVLEGSMPPRRYTLVHPDARLTDAEAERLVAALTVMEDRD